MSHHRAGRAVGRFWRPLVASCAALFVASTAGLGVDAQTTPTIKVLTTPIDLGAEVFYAKDQGFFQKAGLNVEATMLTNGAAIASAVSSGAVDIGQANVASLASAHERGLPFVAIGPAGLYSSKSPATAMIVLKTAAFKTGKDLNGKTIAVSGIKNITQIGAEAWIDQNGGDVSSVKFVEVPFSQMDAALGAHRVDAAVIAEPGLDAAVHNDARVMAPVFDAIAKDFLVGVYFTTTAWAKAHPDEVKKFAAVLADTAKWANRNHAESAKILEKYTKINVSSTMNRVVYADRIDTAQLQPLIDATAKYHAIKATFPAAELLAK